MRGSAVSQSYTRSRRCRYSSSIARTGACDPLSATIAARCAMVDTFEVEWLWIAPIAAITFAGPSAQPQRQLVIAYAFDAEPHKTARSRQVRFSTPATLWGAAS